MQDDEQNTNKINPTAITCFKMYATANQVLS